MIQLFEPQLGGEELYAIQQTFRDRWVGRGPVVQKFEKRWAEHIGQTPEHVTSTTCATEGLFQIMDLIGVNDYEVVMPSISFVGAANAVDAYGGRVVLTNVNPTTLNPDENHIRDKITARTVAVVVLHYGGYPPEQLLEVAELCRKKGIFLIEDSACAQAGSIDGIPLGTVGDFGVWSFDAMKTISAADGGMIYAKDQEFIRELRLANYLGLDSPTGLSSGSDRWWEFEVLVPGRRAIMNDLSASVAMAQMDKLSGFVARRKEMCRRYNDALGNLSDELLVPPEPRVGVEPAYYLYWVQCPYRDGLAAYLKKQGIYTSFRYFPLHQTQYYGPDALPGAEFAGQVTLNLPLHNGLGDSDVEDVIRAVKEFVPQ